MALREGMTVQSYGTTGMGCAGSAFEPGEREYMVEAADETMRQAMADLGEPPVRPD